MSTEKIFLGVPDQWQITYLQYGDKFEYTDDVIYYSNIIKHTNWSIELNSSICSMYTFENSQFIRILPKYTIGQYQLINDQYSTYASFLPTIHHSFNKRYIDVKNESIMVGDAEVNGSSNVKTTIIFALVIVFADCKAYNQCSS